MDGLAPIVIASVSGCYSICNVLYASWNLYRHRKKDKQMKQMQQDITQIASVVNAPAAANPLQDIDTKIASLFDELKTNPTQVIHDTLVALLGQKQASLVDTLQFTTIDEFVAKSEAVAAQFEKMLQLARATLAQGSAGTGIVSELKKDSET